MRQEDRASGYATPERKTLKGYIAAGLAVITCPCHLPVIAVLLSGTAAGAFLAEHMGIALAVLVPVFFVSLVGAVRFLRRKPGNEA